MPNGIIPPNPNAQPDLARPQTWAGNAWAPSPAAVNGTGISPAASAALLGKPPPGRDPKSRARSREYLKQCLLEVSYLTSPQALNPLPNRPIVNATHPPPSSLPVSLPNLPSFGDPVAYNGRPRKLVPEVGKDFPNLNGVTPPPNVGIAVLQSDKDKDPYQTREQDKDKSSADIRIIDSTELLASSFTTNGIQDSEGTSRPTPLESGAGEDPLTAVFRPDGSWRIRLRASNEAAMRAGKGEGTSCLDPCIRAAFNASAPGKEDELMQLTSPSLATEDDLEDYSESVVGDGVTGIKVWRTKRTLRK